MSVKQVLIFDSGVGGLSVFEQMLALTPSLQCHYLFDNAYFPYGELDHHFLITRLTQLLSAFIEQQPIDLIVIACNSASTAALQVLRERLVIPIVGVVPAIKPAAALTKNGVIGLLATPATIDRDYTQSLIAQFAQQCTVLKIGSTALVKLAEQKLRGEVVSETQIREVLAPWLALSSPPDTIVLGCTHFPLLKEEIACCFSQPVTLVDSGKAIALRVANCLQIPAAAIASFPQHYAYYTKAYNEPQLAVLTSSFAEYGISSLQLLSL